MSARTKTFTPMQNARTPPLRMKAHRRVILGGRLFYLCVGDVLSRNENGPENATLVFSRQNSELGDVFRHFFFSFLRKVKHVRIC